MVNSEKFGKRLQKIMEEYDLNATNFADQIDVGRSSISHILSGRNKPSLEFVMKIVETFPEVELYWLLNGKGSFPKESKTVPMREKNQHHDRTLFDVDESEMPRKDEDLLPKAQNSRPLILNNDRPIRRIVIFYEDGTFENYNGV